MLKYGLEFGAHEVIKIFSHAGRSQDRVEDQRATGGNSLGPLNPSSDR